MFIPVICGALFRLGGWGKYKFFWVLPSKWYRWIGIGIALAIFKWNAWLALTYLIATMIPYGDSSWIKKFVSREWNWIIYGFMYGLASFPVLKWWALLQGAIGAFTFWYLMKWSNDGYDGHGKLDHKWVEVWTGFFGTLLYLLV